MTQHTVSTEWLSDHLNDPDIRIVDIRGKVLTAQTISKNLLDHYDSYVQSHIPNAVFLDWIEDIIDDANHKRIASHLKYANAMSKHGISNDHLVVTYDDASNVLAARLWWTLHYYGHTKVAVLDGGWQKWVDDGYEVTSEVPRVDSADFSARSQAENFSREGDDIVQLLNSTARIVDMRLPEEYDGDISLARFNGHIPGAVNLPINTLINADGTLRPAEQLYERFIDIGIDDSASEVIFYSNVGVASCLGILAMRLAGFTCPAKNYDASWQEWGNDEHKPRESIK